MNKTYIKRNVNLYKIGISINEDVKELCEGLIEIGISDSLIRYNHPWYSEDKLFFRNENDTNILYYDKKDKRVHINLNFYNKIEKIFGLLGYENIRILKCFLEAFLNLEVVDILPSRYIFNDINQNIIDKIPNINISRLDITF